MNKAIVSILMVVIFSSCKAPSYVPESSAIGDNPFGSMITINSERDYVIEGELLAVQNNKLYVLSHDWIDSIATEDVTDFRLRYAQPKNYWWTIPVFLAASIPSGSLLVVTAPVGLVIGIAATIRGRTKFVYRKKHLPMEELHTFARYPLGFPPGMDLNALIRNKGY